ncbi:hypothetical protein J2T12_004796 [Paenibacillus anaericanus]|uniref:hypothetical protein n=1 Tax=Paenibacillus anaericanus TaxID=170367 RepID=UPI00277DC83B|nr:hypothetical protein [Paenibacillus anaericanus]MDQ0091359.1 hypothetical protein [Paenibacillus anaericanus]
MMNNESELTRRYLLNSHSRGSLEEVVSEEDSLEFEDEAGHPSGTVQWSNSQFMKQWEGRETTQSYFLESYD